MVLCKDILSVIGCHWMILGCLSWLPRHSNVWHGFAGHLCSRALGTHETKRESGMPRGHARHQVQLLYSEGLMRDAGSSCGSGMGKIGYLMPRDKTFSSLKSGDKPLAFNNLFLLTCGGSQKKKGSKSKAVIKR